MADIARHIMNTFYRGLRQVPLCTCGSVSLSLALSLSLAPTRFEPSFLDLKASYDVASNICQALPGGDA
jgi:hypothetical protein